MAPALAAHRVAPYLADDHSARTLYVVGGVFVVLAVTAIVLGVWGGRRRK